MNVSLMNRVKTVCNGCKRNLMQKPNVVSVGCGHKVKNGKKTDEYCIVVGVTQKMHNINMGDKDIIPVRIDGVPTDVIQVGTIVAQLDPKNRYRPAPPGVSIGHYAITAGTFGCVVTQGNNRYILSNNHVLAFSNEGTEGDNILQPAVPKQHPPYSAMQKYQY